MVDSAVKDYMQQAAEAGRPFALEQVARIELTNTPEWRDVIGPALKEACECTLADELKATSRATSLDEILKIELSLASLVRDVLASPERQEKFQSCLQPLLQKLEAPK